MLDIFAQFATDEALENNGSWVDFNGARFLVARTGNRKYIKGMTAAFEKNQKTLDLKNDEAEALFDRLLIDVLASSVLLGWENVSFKGQPVAYSVETAKQLLGIKDFRREVIKMSEDVNAFRAKLEADQAKN